MVRFLLILPFIVAVFELTAQEENDIYLFSFFSGNGEDGLHLAWSDDGMTWEALNDNQSFLTPEVGKDKLMRDPCIISGPDGKFHMVWTVSWREKGIGYASSEDLMEWSEQKYIPVMEHEEMARNCWAPEVFYDKPSEQYIIFWSTTIPERFPETEQPDEHNHRMYYVTTKDFKNFSDTELFYEHGFNVIDGTLIREKDKYILFLKDETRYPPEKNIRIATSNQLTRNYSKPSEPITGDYWAEGPTPAKVGKYWVVYFDKYRKHSMGAVRSADLENWEDISEQVHFPKGTRHGTVFRVSNETFKKLKNK